MPQTPPRMSQGSTVEVGIRDLRDRLSHFLSEVAVGRTVVVTDRGRAVARIVGIEPVPRGLQRLIDEGLVRMPTKPVTSAKTWKRVDVEGGVTDLIPEQRR